MVLGFDLLLLQIETLVGNSKLIHVVELAPLFSLDIEQLNLTVSISVLASNKDDLVVRNGKG